MRRLIICTPHPRLLSDQIKKNEVGWALGRVKVCTGFWCGNLRERNYLEDPGVDGRIISNWIFRKWVVKAWTGSV